VGVLGTALAAWGVIQVAGVLTAIAVCGVWALAAHRGRVWWERSRSRVLAVAGIAVVIVAMASYPVVRSVLRTRYRNDPVAQWANSLDGQHIAVAGGTLQYVLYGDRLANIVQYVGVEGSHGEFHEYQDCSSWRGALRAGGFDWIFIDTANRRRPPFLDWITGDPAAREVLRTGTQHVFRFTPSVGDTGC
jgi:hypothetical protein